MIEEAILLVDMWSNKKNVQQKEQKDHVLNLNLNFYCLFFKTSEHT